RPLRRGPRHARRVDRDLLAAQARRSKAPVGRDLAAGHLNLSAVVDRAIRRPPPQRARDAAGVRDVLDGDLAGALRADGPEVVHGVLSRAGPRNSRWARLRSYMTRSAWAIARSRVMRFEYG